jgi:Mn2+/Fe2+ NRAMP family transporter
MSSTSPDPAADHRSSLEIENPPTRLGGILRRLGPGMIIAASIVGSGELIGTTKTGADAGYTLLWLILIGCLIKVFVQIEFGRYAVAEGVSTIEGLDHVPGPRLGVNWLVWAWFAMFLTSAIGQLGGILGGVGQLFAARFPITGDFLNQLNQIDAAHAAKKAIDKAALGYTWDDVYYGVIITVVTAVMLVVGRYKIVQHVSTFLVAGFTLVTVFNVFALPYFSDARVGLQYLKEGLSFSLPAKEGALATALATFGIIGVGASELIAYPYWCLECGYARFTGKRDSSSAWAERARGWMRVMRWDAWCSMAVYTFATVAFYVLGAAVLNPRGLSPSDEGLIRTLSKMYEEVFNPWGDEVFLLGAFAVLYSTLFVATAGNARVAADALGVYGLTPKTEDARRRWTKIFCGVFPLFQLLTYVIAKNPVTLVIIAGLAQALLLPMLGAAALYFRFKKCDPRIAPTKLWDAFLWISVAGLTIAGGWGAYSYIGKFLR